jgi:type IV secretion system protein VirB8
MNDMTAVPVPPDYLEQFFQQQESFQAAHVRTARRAARTAWVVAGVSVFITVLAVGGIASFGPMHTVEWRAIRVDSSTGVIEDATLLREAPKSFTEANDRFMLANYVRHREGYAAPEAEYNFKVVSLLSDKRERERYAAEFRGGNVLSVQNLFGKAGYIRVTIDSVSVLQPRKLGQVRFHREEVHDGGSTRVVTLVATIGFEWRPDAAISNADRTINPFGFQVSDYHADADAPR